MCCQKTNLIFQEPYFYYYFYCVCSTLRFAELNEKEYEKTRHKAPSKKTKTISGLFFCFIHGIWWFGSTHLLWNSTNDIKSMSTNNIQAVKKKTIQEGEYFIGRCSIYTMAIWYVFFPVRNNFIFGNNLFPTQLSNRLLSVVQFVKQSIRIEFFS